MNSSKRNRRNSSAGFTLVELIIASGVVGVAIAMAMGSILSVSTAQRTSEADAIAVTMLSGVLEEIRSTTSVDDLYEYVTPDLSNLGLGSSVVVTAVCVDTGDNEIPLPLTGTEGAAPVIPTLPNPAEVRVTIQWRDQEGRVRTMQASTFHRRL